MTKWVRVDTGFEPGAAGCEVRTLPLCYAAPRPGAIFKNRNTKLAGVEQQFQPPRAKLARCCKQKMSFLLTRDLF